MSFRAWRPACPEPRPWERVRPTLSPRIPASSFFANVDYVRRLALVAERETVTGVQLIGVGRYEPSDEPATAEVAFVVEDGWQERGLGAIALEVVPDAAAARGIEQFRADVLADNHRMLRLFTSRTRIEHRITKSGVTSLRLRRAAAGAPPRPGRAG